MNNHQRAKRRLKMAARKAGAELRRSRPADPWMVAAGDAMKWASKQKMAVAVREGLWRYRGGRKLGE